MSHHSFPDSLLIDRLVLGRPPPRELDRAMQRLLEAGWNRTEIANHFQMTVTAVTARILRAQKARAAP